MLGILFLLLSLGSTYITTCALLSSLSLIPLLDFGDAGVWPTLIIYASMAFPIGYALQAITGKYQGEVWGCKITASPKVKLFRFWGVFTGLISVAYILLNLRGVIGGAIMAVINLVVGLIKIMFTGNAKAYFTEALLLLAKAAAFIGSLVIGMAMASGYGLKIYEMTSSLQKFGELSIFRDVDKHIHSAREMDVNGVEIVLRMDQGESLRFVYANYNLPNLLRSVTAAETRQVASYEVGFVGLYLNQKYGKDFSFTIDKERVMGAAGTPGESFRIVTPSGVYSGTIGGTAAIPDTVTFGGYHFVRRK